MDPAHDRSGQRTVPRQRRAPSLRAVKMRRVTLVAALAVVGGLVAAAVLFRPYLPTTCPDARRLDRILGGGLPVCLGKDGSQLDRYANGNHDDSSCSLVQTGP